MIEIENKKLHDYIITKDELVDEGRKITSQIEKKGEKVKAYEDEEKLITGKIAPDPALKEEGDKLIVVFQDALNRLEEIGKEIEKKKLEAIPKELSDKHKQELKEIEQLERDRNKIALKIQKIKDRIIPIVQKTVKPLLGEYDDIETAQTKKGKVIIKTFNHLEEFKARFKR